MTNKTDFRFGNNVVSDAANASSTAAHIFDTVYTFNIDGGNLISFRNNTTKVLDFSYQGGIDHVNSGASTAAHSQSLNLNWGSDTNKTSSGQQSVVIGNNNTASAYNSFAIGASCLVSASNSFATGVNNQVTQTNSFVSGKDASVPNKCTSGIGGAAFSSRGDVQVMTAVIKAATTDATQTTMNAEGTDYVIPADTTWAFSALVVARSDETDGNLSAVWRLEGCLARDESSSTVIVGSVTKTVIADGAAAAWDVTATADDTNEALAIQVTGEAATNIRWVAKLDISQVGYA